MYGGKEDSDEKWDLSDIIAEINHARLYKDGNMQNEVEFDKIIFEPYWEIIY